MMKPLLEGWLNHQPDHFIEVKLKPHWSPLRIQSLDIGDAPMKASFEASLRSVEPEDDASAAENGQRWPQELQVNSGKLVGK